jgi:hypothetical protein
MSTLKSINVIHPSGTTNNIVNDASGNVTVGNDLYVPTGNVGIGTSSPGSKLDVNGTVRSKTSTGGIVNMDSTTTSTTNTIGSYANAGAAFADLNYSAAQHLWIGSGSEKMRIDSSGNLLVGTTSVGSTTGLVVKTSASGVGGVGYFYNTHNTSGDYCAVFAMDSNTNNTSSIFLMCTNPGVANRFAIYGNGTYATASDIDLKKNIQTARDGYLDDIRSLRVVKYNWNTQADDEPKELGFIAQEVEAVFPSLVQESTADGADRSYKSIKTSVIPFILVKAIQELSAKNDALEARLAALEAK